MGFVFSLFHSLFDHISDIIETRGESPLINLLDSLGGWPVLKGQNWNAEGFDWQATIAKLRQFNNDILVTIWVGPDGKDSDDYIVQVIME